jgi:hypothetical protein
LAPVIEVLIGIFFLYLVLSLIVSAINEGIAGIFGRRSKYLEKGIKSLLGAALTGDFFKHPLIRSLSNEDAKLRFKRKPSYISASTFTETVLDLVRKRPFPTAGSGTNSPTEASEDIQDLPRTGSLAEAPILPNALRIFKDAAKDLEDFKKRVDAWFEEAMNRVSGWYTRYTRMLLFIIGIVLVSVINADTINIASTLWRDASIRDAVVEQAGTVASGDQPDPDQARDQLRRLEELNMPLGWNLRASAADPRGWPATVGEYAIKILGLLITGLALTFGSTFWFDLLKKFVGVRSAGAEPQPAQTGPPSGAAEQPQRLEVVARP